MSSEDYRRFEEFINDFMDGEYEDWIEGEDTTWNGEPVKGASEKQAEFARSVRAPLSEQEEEDIEDQQEYIPEQSRVQEVYDNRDLQPVRRQAVIQYNPAQPNQAPQVIIPEQERRIPPTGRAPTLPQPTITTIKQVKPNIFQRLARFFRRRK